MTGSTNSNEGDRMSRTRKYESRHLRGCSTFHGRAPVTGRKPPGLFSSGTDQGPLNGFSTWLKSQGFWMIPEQLLEPVVPGQPPLSRWTAQIDNVLKPFALA